MLVGCRSIPSEQIQEALTVSQLKRLAVNSVPLLFRHIPAIVNNQKYLLALEVRKMYKGDYNKWHPLCTGLLEGVTVTGSVHDIYTCYDLLQECDMSIIEKFIEKEE